MERLELIQKLIDSRGYSTYLEIGVLGGGVFFAVKCRRKIAVDPQFKFNWKGRLGETIRNPYNLNSDFHEITSDEFFAKEASGIFSKNKLDIALVDGMHEFRYALNDVNSCLSYLSDDGVIIMHDCNPLTEEAACSFVEWQQRNYEGYWNGDVWKVIHWLRQNRPDLEVFVADCDHGLGIITRKTGLIKSAPVQAKSAELLTYDDLDKNRVSVLNLQPASVLEVFIQNFQKTIHR
jgi:hypothetical protein